MTSQNTLTGRRAVLIITDIAMSAKKPLLFFFFALPPPPPFFLRMELLKDTHSLCYAKKTPTYYMNQARTGSRIHIQFFIVCDTTLFRPYCCFYEDVVFSQNWAISFEQLFQCKCIPS